MVECRRMACASHEALAKSVDFQVMKYEVLEKWMKQRGYSVSSDVETCVPFT